VCVCVSVREQISPEIGLQYLPNFGCLLPMTMARSSSGGVAIRYVVPVLWMVISFIASISTGINRPTV